uniref:Protein quiver n=1 Tax=Syphacia muris TaxID=451379 RepID=A0A0N5ASJ0_9BILA
MHLSAIFSFYEPRNFTSQCDDPMDSSRIGTVLCRSICLTIVQDFISFGRKTGKKLTIRGCSTSINKRGFFNRTLSLFDRYDICKDVTATELFRYDGSTQLIRVCSCLGDRCNANRANNLSLSMLTVYITVLMLLL